MGDVMRILSREELRKLIESPQQPMVSIYMPAHRTGDTEQDPIRLKNLLRDAENQLIRNGMDVPNASKLLKPAQQLLSDSYFWQHQGDGLAIFLSPDIFHYYRVPHSFQELVIIAERFHIKPLLPLFSEDGAFYVLAVSQNLVRLFHCNRYFVREVTPEAVPESLADVLKYDQPEKQLQFHTTGRGSSIFHGQGLGKDDNKVNILRYFQQIDHGLHELLREEHVPLVMAAVDYLHPIYREANTYAHLLEETIEGNPDELSAEELQERAWAIVKPYFERARADKLKQYNEAVSKGLATNDVREAVLAAYDGRISTLFVALGVQQWGQFDPEHRKIRLYEESRPDTEDLLDFSAVNTLIRGGVVYALEPEQVPDGSPVAAIFRY
jgi:hypothetical protein